MSQFNAQQPPGNPPREDAFDAEMMPSGPVPMSGMAIAGLTCSAVVCCLGLSPLLGLIFSIVGLVQTKGGRRRGRGLAIAGLIISLVIGLPASVFAGMWIVNYSMDSARVVQNIVAFQQGNLDQKVGVLYDTASPELKAKVSKAQVVSWLQSRFDARGGIQGVELDSKQPITPPVNPSARVELTFNFVAKFPAGGVPLNVKILLDSGSGHWMLSDLVLDGESLSEKTGGAGTPSAKSDDAGGD